MATEKPTGPKVPLTLTWDEGFQVIRALDRSIAVMEDYMKVDEEPEFWADLIAFNKLLRAKIEDARITAIVKGDPHGNA